MAGPESKHDDVPEFDSIEERLAFAEIALAGATAGEQVEDPEAPPPDDPFAAFPD